MEIDIRVIDRGRVIREGTIEAETKEEALQDLRAAESSLGPGQWIATNSPEITSISVGSLREVLL
jgi:hypothetical protein